MGIRDEIRADRAATAQQRRADADAAHQRRLDAHAAQAEQDRADRAAAEQRRAERGQRRAQYLADGMGWARQHLMELLFVPVIVVPAVLAWSAMAAYGTTIYGPVGVLLPLFSEAAMWAFAAATTIAVRRDPHRPVAPLKAGTWIFATIAATLNYLHGVAAGDSIATGLVMALVSVGGVVVHQLVTAGPLSRRSRTERAAARLRRRMARREQAMARAAVRRAVGELADDGTVRLRYRPGTVTLTRSWLARRRLVDAVVPGLVPAGSDETTQPGEELATEITTWLADQPAEAGRNRPGTAQTPDTVVSLEQAEPGETERFPTLLQQARQAMADGRLSADPSRREVQRFLRVRAVMATRITRALRNDGGESEEVPA